MNDINITKQANRIFDRFYSETLSHLSDHDTKEDARLSALICIDEMSKFAIAKGVYKPEYIIDFIEGLKKEIKKI